MGDVFCDQCIKQCSRCKLRRQRKVTITIDGKPYDYCDRCAAEYTYKTKYNHWTTMTKELFDKMCIKCKSPQYYKGFCQECTGPFLDFCRPYYAKWHREEGLYMNYASNIRGHLLVKKYLE